MRINIYDKWTDYPKGRERPYKIVSTSKLRLNTKRHSSTKILARLANITKVSQCHEGKLIEKQYLVVLVDKDYENSLIGSAEQIHKFVRDSLVDQGLMSLSWGRKK